MPTSLITAMVFFVLLFGTIDILALCLFLKARKKLRTAYTESSAYIWAEYDLNMARFAMVIGTAGILVSLWPLTWSVY